MYSWEIRDYLESKGYSLTREEYAKFDPMDSPQICRVSYDTYSNRFIIYTSEGYKFEFEVKTD